ncbi:hypothetical protein MESS2_p70010 [Mesorhizobium metallidurans STM 2683]|uniref:Nucleotidyl transferase AbiEii/AbiGii toxin family protein n=1 Tax=Mesorhizobium metallidurans STM 2683 TaxID=1297569 RepID=M5FCA9_9HYPH|nr:hypothetical protein MESS2_p70010 [Mesorhizobium metallidurans STM 2683]
MPGGDDFEWSFGGGTAMMIQIGHRKSRDIDIFLDDPQLLEFHLHFETMPSDYLGDGFSYRLTQRSTGGGEGLFTARTPW